MEPWVCMHAFSVPSPNFAYNKNICKTLVFTSRTILNREKNSQKNEEFCCGQNNPPEGTWDWVMREKSTRACEVDMRTTNIRASRRDLRKWKQPFFGYEIGVPACNSYL